MTEAEFNALDSNGRWELWGLIAIEGQERKVYHCPKCTVFTDLRLLDELIGTHCRFCDERVK